MTSSNLAAAATYQLLLVDASARQTHESMGADAHSRSSKGKYQAVPAVEAAPLEVESGSAKSPREEKRLAQPGSGLGQALRAVLATALYCAAGPCLIFLNKHILVDIEFPYGSFLSLMGIMLSTFLSGGALALGAASSDQLGGITPWFYVTRVGPIGAALALCLGSGNAAYLYNSVAFVQILKAFAPVVLLVLLFATRLERPSAVLVLSILVISSGTAIAVQGAVHMSAYGVLVMLASEVFEAIKLIMMQVLLVDKKFGSVEGLFVIGPAAIVALAVTSFLLEDTADAARKVAANPAPFVVASCGGQGRTRVIQRRFNVGVSRSDSQEESIHALRSSREMIARPKMSQVEWKPIEI